MQKNNNYNKNRRSNNNNRSQNFDSNGPTGRIKGSAKQISEKYMSMARDSYASGDNISMENYYQHAEHYFRINNYLNDQAEQKRKTRENQQAKRPVEVKKVEAKPAQEEKSEKKVKRNTTRKTKIGSKKEDE